MKRSTEANIKRKFAVISSRMHDKKTETPDYLQDNYAVAVRGATEPFDGLARKVKLSSIKPDPKQPRKTMDKDKLLELAESIKKNGVLQPVILTYKEKEEVYYLVNGERRFAATKKAGLDFIPAIIRPSNYNERQRLQEQLVENIQRENIPPIEEARAIQMLMDADKISIRQAGERLGKPKSYIGEIVGILRIPTKKLERAKKLPKQALVEISKGKNEKEQDELLKAALNSKAPLQEAKKKRTDHQADLFNRTRYKLERYKGARVTVEIPKGVRVKPPEVLKAALKEARKG